MAKTLLVKSPIEDVFTDDPKFMAKVRVVRRSHLLGKDTQLTRDRLHAVARSAIGRRELVDAVADRANLSKMTANMAVEAVFESIVGVLKGGGEVRLVGFGTFSVGRRAASEGRNPRTGEKIKIAASRQTKFKPGRRLRDQLN